MRGFHHLFRWRTLQRDLDDTQLIPGSRSVPPDLAKLIMTVGLLAVVFGPAMSFPLLLLGISVFGVGLMVAVIQALFER